MGPDRAHGALAAGTIDHAGIEGVTGPAAQDVAEVLRPGIAPGQRSIHFGAFKQDQVHGKTTRWLRKGGVMSRRKWAIPPHHSRNLKAETRIRQEPAPRIHPAGNPASAKA
jgi:hypothetical protein